MAKLKKGLSPWKRSRKLEIFPDQKNRVENDDYVSLGDRVSVLIQNQGFRKPAPSAYQYQEEPDTYEAINAHRLDPIDIAVNKQIIAERYKSAIDERLRLIKSQEASQTVPEAPVGPSKTEVEPEAPDDV